jgi:hypothetical protein
MSRARHLGKNDEYKTLKSRYQQVEVAKFVSTKKNRFLKTR